MKRKPRKQPTLRQVKDAARRLRRSIRPVLGISEYLFDAERNRDILIVTNHLLKDQAK